MTQNLQFKLLSLVIYCVCCLIHMQSVHAQSAHVENLQAKNQASGHMQIIVAAEMPEITDLKVGRYAELKRLVDDEKNRVSPSFFIFGGGSIGPSVFANFDRGSHIIDILNHLEPDAMGVAKREFSFFEDELSLRAYEALFPVVASNIVDKRIGAVPDGLMETALIERDGFTLGFVSLLDERLISEYLLTFIDLLDPQQMVRKRSEQLKAAGADFVFLHYFEDFKWVHQLLDEGVVNHAFIANTRLHPAATARLTKDKRILLLDKPGEAKVASFKYTDDFEFINERTFTLSDYEADLATAKVLDSYIKRVNRLLDDRVAHWDGTFSTRREDVRSSENAFANFVADAMREYGSADVAIMNGGSIRGDRLYQRNEPITRRTIATELPFRSTLRLLSISGADLLQALEHGFALLDSQKGVYPHVSGMQVEINSDAKPGARIISAKINGESLQADKKYRLMTTDYLAEGGDGYVSFGRADVVADSTLEGSILISDLVLRTLRIRGKLDSRIEGRITDRAGNN